MVKPLGNFCAWPRVRVSTPRGPALRASISFLKRYISSMVL
jgi:hypothetical protein